MVQGRALDLTTASRIEWRAMARDDLRRIIRYIGGDNPTRAKSFSAEIRDKVGSLVHHPEIGRAGRIDGVRELVVHPNYVVFYRVLPKARVVEVLRIKHAAQQLP